MLRWYVPCCGAFARDRSSGGDADMDRGRGDGHASWVPWTLRPGADGAGTAAFVGPRLRLPRQARRYREGALVRWRRSVPAGQAAGTRTFRVAAGDQLNGLAEPCAVVDAAGKHRLERACVDSRTGDERVGVFPGIHAAFPLLIGCRLCHTALMFSALSLPDLDTMDHAALKALLLAQQDHYEVQQEQYTATLTSRTGEIERLLLLVEKLQRMLFGARSEKVLRQIEQLELQLEELHVANAVEELQAVAPAERPAAAKPFRRPLPEHLPREVYTHLPNHEACPDCGGRLRELGEDAAEMLEYVRACFKVIRHVRPKLSCDACDRIVQAPRLHDPVAGIAAQLRAHMADDLEAGPHVLQHLGGVFAEFAQPAAAIGAGFVVGQVRVDFARKMLGQRTAKRLRGSGAFCRSYGLQLFDGVGNVQLF